MATLHYDVSAGRSPGETAEVVGIIKSVRWRDQQRFDGRLVGPRATMLVLDDPAFEVWGSMPRSIERALIPVLYAHRDSCVNIAELVRSAPIRVRFRADLYPSRHDVNFGSFRLPRNGC